MEQTLVAVLSYLPPPLATTTASLSAASSVDASGDDLIGRLPDALLSKVISRLPAKDAARTALLSSRWRGLWASTPLLLDDSHLLPAADERCLVAAITHALGAHPGPFRSVRLTSIHLASQELALASWLASLAAKNAQELVVVNRPWPLDVPLPAGVLLCAELRRLCVGFCRFPDTSGLPPAFAWLRELALLHASMRDRDLEAVLACCAELESLALVLTQDYPKHVHLRTGSLRCAALWMSMVKEVHIDDAPNLERLVLEPPESHSSTHIKIFNAPKLQALGYFDPSFHMLKVGATVIKVETKVSSSATVRSLETLALKVRFGVEEQAKLLPVLLKCFPCIETLYITSIAAESPSNLDVKFWDQLGYIECVQSHMKKVVFEAVRGESSELAFVEFVMGRAQMLEEMHLIVDDSCSREVFDLKLSALPSDGYASADAKIVVGRRAVPSAWSFHTASDLSRRDPFYGSIWR